MLKPYAPKVFQLGYVGVDTPDLARALDYYGETVGMTETDRGDGASYLSVGYEHHNIILRQTAAKGLGNIGLQLKPDSDLAALRKEAQNLGLKAEIKTDSQPGIREMLEIEAPGKIAVQLYTDIDTPAPGFKRTGIAPLRLGHVAIISSDAKRLMVFIEDFLGFRFTDTIEGIANFYTCNRDHHVLNIVDAPEDRIHHIAFQLKGNASHAMASDVLRERGVKVEWGPARHTAGHNLAGYHFDPDRVLIELYTDMDVYIPELDMCEARPWHEHLPMRPRNWKLSELSAWGTDFEFNLAQA
ncbi:glyoxalase/bleomycin resistance/extradiol dioxygenase family protein [Paracoccus versutus]|uniref:Catechol-2,3-dioxygenase n=1 Tax=Paracoccus versutus TaxID=34007 RepID=A0AAQ0HEI9_PARVE|nr:MULTISPECIES: VOC family protein [Paracoccus]KGJ08956.1 bleomycin resistance protein [Paracoccus versutus]MBT0779080.1 VOC family protein [Paracoccus sp. pheM1]REG35271.1 catechol-2,3-dioxygenase [Paracoccus versutus]WEJ77417.1 glyoxalase/bleomycin resistance/extradiol dioxygenase family protein [Paracoccus versutus]